MKEFPCFMAARDMVVTPNTTLAINLNLCIKNENANANISTKTKLKCNNSNLKCFKTILYVTEKSSYIAVSQTVQYVKYCLQTERALNCCVTGFSTFIHCLSRCDKNQIKRRTVGRKQTKQTIPR